jgi:hypothetical protein
MPELLPARVLTGLRRMTLAVACLLPACGLPGGAWAQNVPAGLRACAAESDPGQRLDCYDREMKRLSALPAHAAQAAPAAEPEPQTPKPAPIHPAAPSMAAAPSSDIAAATSGSGTVAKPEPAPSAPRTAAWKKLFSGGAPWHVTAHIVSLDRSPDAMVLHLDNGQAWRQIGRASGDLGLHAGDQVTIARHLGGYWLSSRYVSDMQVRQETR